jgi:hypothetical protein
MRSIFKIILILIFSQEVGLSIGTQFLAIPKNNFELISGYNPMLSRGFARPTISATYGNWIADMKLTNISFSKGFENGYGGLDLRYISLNDLELRTERPSDEPISYYSSSAYTVDTWYGKAYGTTSIKLAVRYLSIQLYDENSDGFAIDFVANKRIKDGYSIGAAILNLGSMGKMYSEKPELPLRAIIGGQIDFDIKQTKNEVAVSLEKSSMVKGLIIRVSDYIKYNNLQFMVGSQYSNKEVSVSGGINFTFGSYIIGYAVQVGSHALGIPQYLNLSIILP